MTYSLADLDTLVNETIGSCFEELRDALEASESKRNCFPEPIHQRLAQGLADARAQYDLAHHTIRVLSNRITLEIARQKNSADSRWSTAELQADAENLEQLLTVLAKFLAVVTALVQGNSVAADAAWQQLSLDEVRRVRSRGL